MPATLTPPLRVPADDIDRRASRPLVPRGTWGAVLLAVLLALAIRFPPLGRESLDMDEAFSQNVLRTPFRMMMWEIRADRTHPPFYYMLLRPYAVVAGTSPTALRLPSMAAGLGTVALAAVGASVLTASAPAGALAGALVAVSETQLFYSQQLRSYALYALLVLATLLTLAWVLRAPERRPRWLVLAVVIGLATQTHYLSWMYIGAAGLYVLLARDLRRWFPWLVAACLPAVAALGAWVAIISGAIADSGLSNLSWIERPTVWSLVTAAWRMVGFPQRSWTQERFFWMSLAATAALVIGIRLVWRLFRSRPASTADERLSRHVAWILLLCCALAPILLTLPSFPPLRRHIFVDRHLIPSQALWAMLVAMGWAALRTRRPRAATVAALALVALPMLSTLAQSRYPRRLRHREAAEYIAARSAPGDMVIVADYFNVGWPQRAHLDGRREVRSLVRMRDSLPDRFWLVSTNRQIELERLAEAATGSHVRREAVRFTNHPGGQGPVRVERYERVAPAR